MPKLGDHNGTKKLGRIYDDMEITGSRRIQVNGKPIDQYQIRCIHCGAERWHNASSVGRCRLHCYQCEPDARPMTPNGIKKTAPKGLYMSYHSMLNRCYGKTSDRYPFYGGRGITVCHEWRFNYKAFEKWAFENGWEEGKTIDRIDPNGNYEPLNCRWADKATQANNVRSNIHLSYEGEDMTLAQFCEKTGMQYDRARYLIFRKGISPEEALTMK